MHGLVPAGRDDPLWWTLRRPFRQLNYHAARAMFVRGQRAAGRELVSARLAAHGGIQDGPGPAGADHRRAVDPGSRASFDHADVCHPASEDVIGSVLAHHRRAGRAEDAAAEPAPGYRAETLDILFGRQSW